MEHNRFNKLYLLYEDKLKYFIYNTATHDMYATEDIFHNTMVKAYKYINTLKDEFKIYAWLRKVAWNEAMTYNKVNAKANNLHIIEDSEGVDAENQDLAEPDFSVEFVSSETFLYYLKSLSANEQSLFILHYVYDYELKDIAKMRGENKNTTKSIYRRGLLKLKRLVEKESAS